MKRLLIICCAIFAYVSASAVEFIYNGPYLQGVTDNAAYIVWLTDKASEGWVEIKGAGLKATYVESQNGVKWVRRDHRIAVTGLKAGQQYEYKVYSKDPKTGKVISLATNTKGEKLTFKTLDHNKEEITWLMATDIHYNKYIPNLFQRIFTPERLEGKDFVIFDGDIADSFSSEKRHFNDLFSTITSTFASNLQYYMARGNHETRGGAANRYMDFHPTWTGMPYYAFRHGPVFFIFLDSGEDKPDSDIEYSGTAVFDEYRRNEGEWLAKVLESKECKEAPFRIVVNHIPLSPGGWHGGRHAHAMFAPHLEKADITIMLSGHLHRYSYRKEGKNNKTFPTLIIGADGYLDVKANSKTLTLERKDLEGNVQHTFVFESKKK